MNCCNGNALLWRKNAKWLSESHDLSLRPDVNDLASGPTHMSKNW